MQAELSAFQNVLDRKGIFGNYQLSTAEKPLLMQKYAIDVSCLGKCVLALVIPWDGGSHSDFRHMAWHSVATTYPCMGHHQVQLLPKPFLLIVSGARVMAGR